MKTSTSPEAFCAEMHCDWQGEVPAVARCPKCHSNQVRRAQSKDDHARSPTYEQLLAQRDVLLRACEQVANAYQPLGHPDYMCKAAMAKRAGAAVAKAREVCP